MKKILFISHEATLSGAPQILLNFMGWLKQHQPTYAFDILLLKGGPNEKNFEAIAGKVFKEIPAELPSFFQRLARKITAFPVKSGFDKLLNEIGQEKYDLVYANTIVSLYAGITIKERFKIPLISHVHELSTVVNLLAPDLKEITHKVDKFIAVSKQMAGLLEINYQIPANKIARVYEFVSPKTLPALGSKSNLPVIGATGFVHWRKGYDLFIQVAQKIVNNLGRKDMQFQWVGKYGIEEKAIIEEDLRKSGLEQYVTFTGETTTPFAYYNNFSVFLMTSREDPFPLVNLEVGSLGVPIVCFKGGGGTEELLEAGGGKVVPYLDIDAMAREALFYIDNPEARIADGTILKEKVKEFTTENIAPELFRIISQLI